MNLVTLVSRAAFLLPLTLLVGSACGSKDDRGGSPKPLAASSTTTSAPSGQTASGAGGQGAGLPECEGQGGAGGVGEAATGSQRLGLRAEPRPDDVETILARGGSPFPEADPDRVAKNAYLRVELGLGTEPGKTTSLRFDHQVHGLSAEGWPTDYDAWTTGNDRRLLISIPSVDKLGATAAYCEVVGTTAFDETIAKAAARVKTFVDDNVKDAVYLAWGHDFFPRDGRARLVTKSAVTFTGTPNKVVVETREGVGVTCPFPKSLELNFTSPDGTQVVKTLSFAEGKVGDNDVYVNAQFGTVEAGWLLRYQQPSEEAASYVASFKKVRAAMEAVWGAWPGKSKIRWTWVVPNELVASLAPFYPGDDQVDAIGVDAINPYGSLPNAPFRPLADMLTGVREFAAGHGGKEVLVASTGALDGLVIKSTAAATAGSKAGVAVEALPESVTVGTDVYFFDSAGKTLGKGTVATLAIAGTTLLVLDMLDANIPSGSTGLARQPARNKAKWIEDARTFLGNCAPDVSGVIWRTGPPLGYWLDQGPQAAPDVLDAFRAWALDPHFAGK